MPQPSQWRRLEKFNQPFIDEDSNNFIGDRQFISGIETDRFKTEAREARPGNGPCVHYSNGILVYVRDIRGLEYISLEDPENYEMEF